MTATFERMSRNARRRAAAFCLALAAAVGAYAEKKSEEEAQVTGPPPPRVVAPLPLPPPPPDPTDPSWLNYREGRDLFEAKRFGEALDAFRKAIDARAERSAEAVQRIDAALARAAEAAQAKGSLRALVELLAARDLIDSDLERVRSASGGSLVKEMSLIAERRPSSVLDAFIKATKLVLAEAGGKRVGDSLAELKTAALSMRYYPEAEYAIGRIYLAEGELSLAELQIRRAIDMSESLDVPAERYTMLEELAEIYRTSSREREYETTLREIADCAGLFAKKQEFLRTAMERTLARDGIDKFMLLYRLDETFARSAFSKLGAQYIENGRPLAVIYLAAAVNTSLTEIISALRERDSGYAYSTITDALERTAADRELSRYAKESGLYRDMYLLGEALAAGGSRDSARGIWKAIAAIQESAPWDIEAKNALARPPEAPGPYSKPLR
jgi:tetratricopeptide (TPR) repeat protein